MDVSLEPGCQELRWRTHARVAQHTTVGDVLRSDLPEVRPSWTLRAAIGAMGDSDVDVLAVTDADASFIGLVREDDILKLDEILEETGG